MDCNAVENGAGQFELRLWQTAAVDAEQANRHQHIERTHLPLVFIAAVTTEGGNVAFGRCHDAAHPFLCQPRGTGVVEEMRQVHARLVAIVHVAVRVVGMGADEVVGLGLLEKRIEFLHKGFPAAEQLD